MSGTRLPTIVFLVILFGALADCLQAFYLMPERIATHFTASGTPIGWMTKQQFFELHAFMIVLSAAVGFLTPLLIASIPSSKINLPNKEYWLAPERRGKTLAFLSKHFAWFGCVFLFLNASVMQLIIEGNILNEPQLSTGVFLFLICAFIFFTIVWSLAMVRRFSNLSASV